MINGADTLIASAQLRRLRDLELLEQKGKGNATYYVPTQKMLFPEKAPQISPLSEDLREMVRRIGKRAFPNKIKQVVKQLCLSRPFKPNEIALLLQRNQRYLRDNYLSPMVESGELELGFPDNPTHFQQSYKTKES